VAARVRAVSPGYRSVRETELAASVRESLVAMLDLAAGRGRERLDEILERRISARAAASFAPDDVLALVDCAEAALADALEEPAGRAALGDPSWPAVAAAADHARAALLARLGLFDDAEAGASVRRLVHDRRIGALLAQVLRARSEERAALGRKLHDGPVQSLTAALLRLDALRGRLAGPEAAEAADVIASLRQSLDETRALMFAPAADVAGDGLARALQVALERFGGDYGIEAELDDRLPERPPPDVELLAFRIAEEALANVAVHSRAQRVRVRLAREGSALELEIADDGRGFDPAHARQRSLALARARAGVAGGELTVRSGRGEGTTVRLTLPWT
jgi:two-component system sensor histidine kinase UhpB